MNNILILGAGRSSTAMIDYILDEATRNNWFVTIGDLDPNIAAQKIKNHPSARPAWLDVNKVNDRRDMITRTDIVVSLLPAKLHLEVAHDCIKLKKHLITSSTVAREMYRLGDEARVRELVFTGKMSLEPGLEHMAARKRIDEINEKGGKLTAFRSYNGGLVAPDSIGDNPWKFKFTWNPHNLVRIGQGSAQFLYKNKLKLIPYHQLFNSLQLVDIEGIGKMEMVPNRDSLLHKAVYGLENVPTIIRGTLRFPGFYEGWNALVQLGLTDEYYPIHNADSLSFYEWLDAYVSGQTGSSVKERVANKLGITVNSPIIKQLTWLGLFRKKKMKVHSATPAFLLEQVLLEKWKLKPEDKDLLIMQQEFEYELNGKSKRLVSTLSLKGEDGNSTALSRAIGLPLGIVLKMVIDGKITETGMDVFMKKSVYEPVLTELEKHGLVFKDIEY